MFQVNFIVFFSSTVTLSLFQYRESQWTCSYIYRERSLITTFIKLASRDTAYTLPSITRGKFSILSPFANIFVWDKIGFTAGLPTARQEKRSDSRDRRSPWKSSAGRDGDFCSAPNALRRSSDRAIAFDFRAQERTATNNVVDESKSSVMTQ